MPKFHDDKQKTEKMETCKLPKYLLIILCFHLMYCYYLSETVLSVRIKDPKFKLLSPYNDSNTHVVDNYNKLIDIENFSFLINPQPCRGYEEGLLLVIIISSNPNNYDKRSVIRSTWGQSSDTTKLVFLVGESENSTLSRQIENESEMHGDMVQGTFTDAYRNMTYKHVMGLKWVTHHCPTARYVLKTDDDVLVNSNALRRFLARELSPWGANELIICKVHVHAPIQRSPKSKWRVSPKEFNGYYYPNYCSGGSILYSQDVVAKLLSAAQSTPYFWIDDVHITGVIAEKLGIARTPLSSLILSEKRAKRLKDLGPTYTGQFLFGPPELNTARMADIWRAIPS